MYVYVCVCMCMYRPLGRVVKAKAGSGLLTWTAWVQFPPSPTHDTCLLCSAMSSLMKLACLYVYVSVAIACWGTETTTASPKHPLVTPHQGGPTQGTPGHVPNHFLTPSQYPTSTRFWDFCSKISVWTCIATAVESATSIGTGQNIAH